MGELRLPVGATAGFRLSHADAFGNTLTVHLYGADHTGWYLASRRFPGHDLDTGRQPLGKGQWRTFLNLIEQSNFWELPRDASHLDPGNVTVEDGDLLGISGREGDRYHRVHRFVWREPGLDRLLSFCLKLPALQAPKQSPQSGEKPSTLRLSRSTWSSLSEDQLLAQCEVDTSRASGPGGQKRNKTSSAVRLRHTPTGLIVIAEESRSQHENKAKALQRLWKALFLNLRDEFAGESLAPEAISAHPDYREARDGSGKLHMNAKNPRFWPAVGVVLDVLNAVEARVADAAELLGVSTGNLIDFLQTDPKLWQEANRLRAVFGHKSLR